MTTFAVVANRPTPTNMRLGPVLTPAQAVARLRAGDVALGRIDVSPTLDGVEAGLWALDVLERRGITVLNGSAAIATAHDKLATASVLACAGLPHPPTFHIAPGLPRPSHDVPLVLKPRFGSWGRDVMRCDTPAELDDALARAKRRLWFNSTGGVLQLLVPPSGYDLRIIVAAGRVVGAVKREAAPGEWRTNIALGGRRVPFAPPPAASKLALAAAEAIGGDLVGIDLLPLPAGGYVVLELNGAVDFTAAYSLNSDVFLAARSALLESVGFPLDAQTGGRDRCGDVPLGTRRLRERGDAELLAGRP
jgi:RimK family alpha-L-glutamate ligase